MKKQKKIISKHLRRLIALIGLISTFILMGCSTEDADITESNDFDVVDVTSSYDLDVIDAADDLYVYDFANIFSENQKADLAEKAAKLDSNYDGIQVVITTIESFEKAVIGEKTKELNIDNISYSMYEQYGIGKDSMGILILFSEGEREIKIATGWKMQMYFADALCNQIIERYGIPYFSEDNFAEGLISVQTEVINEIEKRVPIDWNESEAIDLQEEVEAEANNISTKESEILIEETKNSDSNKNVFLAIITGIGGMFAALWYHFKSKFSKEKKLEHEKIQQILTEKENQYNMNLLELQNRLDKMQEETTEKKSEIRDLKSELHTAQLRIGQLKRELETLKEKYSRIQTLHPEFDFNKEVEEMIENEYKVSALDIDKQLSEVESGVASGASVSFFADAIGLYEKTIPQVKKYITTDIKKIRALHDESVFMKQEFERKEKEKHDIKVANDFSEALYVMLSNIGQVGNHENYEVLERLYQQYYRLSSQQKGFISNQNNIIILKELYQEAKEDNEDFSRAREKEKFVEDIVNSIYSADEDDLDTLKDAMNEYKKLTSKQKEYFSAELLRKLKKMLKEAEEAQEYREARIHQRRLNQLHNTSNPVYRSNSSSSSHRNSSRSAKVGIKSSSHRSSSRSSTSRPSSSVHRTSYRGHGSRPSGGGASRKF